MILISITSSSEFYSTIKFSFFNSMIGYVDFLEELLEITSMFFYSTSSSTSVPSMNLLLATVLNGLPSI